MTRRKFEITGHLNERDFPHVVDGKERSYAGPENDCYVCRRNRHWIDTCLSAHGRSADHERMQRKISSGKKRRYPWRAKMERFPQVSMRYRRRSHPGGDTSGSAYGPAAGSTSDVNTPREPGLPNGRVTEVLERIRRESTDAHLP